MPNALIFFDNEENELQVEERIPSKLRSGLFFSFFFFNKVRKIIITNEIQIE